MNREALLELTDRISGSVGLMQHFLREESDDVKVAAELLGRCAIIDSKLAEIRGRMAAQEPHLHVLGDRPDGDAA